AEGSIRLSNPRSHPAEARSRYAIFCRDFDGWVQPSLTQCARKRGLSRSKSIGRRDIEAPYSEVERAMNKTSGPQVGAAAREVVASQAQVMFDHTVRPSLSGVRRDALQALSRSWQDWRSRCAETPRNRCNRVLRLQRP